MAEGQVRPRGLEEPGPDRLVGRGGGGGDRALEEQGQVVDGEGRAEDRGHAQGLLGRRRDGVHPAQERRPQRRRQRSAADVDHAVDRLDQAVFLQDADRLDDEERVAPTALELLEEGGTGLAAEEADREGAHGVGRQRVEGDQDPAEVDEAADGLVQFGRAGRRSGPEDHHQREVDDPAADGHHRGERGPVRPLEVVDGQQQRLGRSQPLQERDQALLHQVLDVPLAGATTRAGVVTEEQVAEAGPVGVGRGRAEVEGVDQRPEGPAEGEGVRRSQGHVDAVGLGQGRGLPDQAALADPGLTLEQHQATPVTPARGLDGRGDGPERIGPALELRPGPPWNHAVMVNGSPSRGGTRRATG